MNSTSVADVRGLTERRISLSQGHAQYRIGFTQREDRGEDYPAKVEQREIVADHLLSGLASRKKLDSVGKFDSARTGHFHQFQGCGSPHAWFFTLPGVTWKFEHLLIDRASGAMFQLIGAEHSWRTFQEGLKNIPGRRRLQRTSKRGIGVTVDHDFGQLYHAKASAVLWACSERFAGAWLDFNGPICAEVISAVKYLGQSLERSMPRVPVAISVLAARESDEYAPIFRGQGHEFRAGFLGEVCAKAARGTWVPLPSYCHTSLGGSPFVTAIGHVVR